MSAAKVNGVFALNKPVGPSCAQVLNVFKWKLKRHLPKFCKVGHGGTLDPAASGVLVVGVGEGTRRMKHFLSGTKGYVATGILGAETESDDSHTDKISKRAPFEHVTREMIEEILPEFRGDVKQIPPIYSALKMDGKPLYAYALKGNEPPRELVARNVKVYSLELLDFNRDHSYHYPTNFLPHLEADKTESILTRFVRRIRDPTLPPPAPVFRLSIESGPGFYVRSLIRDVARAVGSAAHVVQLERCRQGMFHIEDCLLLDQLLSADGPELMFEAIRKAEDMLLMHEEGNEESEAESAQSLPGTRGGLVEGGRQTLSAGIRPTGAPSRLA